MQVVMADFGYAQVLDRLLVYERRIEDSLYRMMAELRRERQAGVAVEGQASRRAGTLTAKPCRTLRSRGRVAHEGQCTPAPGELGSFGVGAKRTPDGVTTNSPKCGNHGRDPGTPGLRRRRRSGRAKRSQFRRKDGCVGDRVASGPDFAGPVAGGRRACEGVPAWVRQSWCRRIGGGRAGMAASGCRLTAVIPKSCGLGRCPGWRGGPAGGSGRR